MISTCLLLVVALVLLVLAWRLPRVPGLPPGGWDCVPGEFDSAVEVPDGDNESMRYRFWITEADGTRRLVGAILRRYPELHLGQSVRLAVLPDRKDLQLLDPPGLSPPHVALILGAAVCVLLAVLRLAR